MLLTTQTHFAPAQRSNPEQLQHSSQQFLNNEILVQSLNAIPELVLILDGNRQVVYANRPACTCFRRQLPYLVGQRPGELLHCANARTAPGGCGTGEACRTCGAVLAILDAQTGCQSSRECRILRDSAQGCEALDFRVQCQPFPLNDESYTIFVAQDISVEKRKDVLERTFFHDLLNLAGGMQGLTALLQDEVVTFEEVKQDLFTCAHALVQEIKSQQMLLAAEQERLALNLVPLSAAEALTVVQQAYRSHPVAGDREIWLAPDTADFILTTDPAILHRILGNLTKNALEASPPGSQVRLGCRAVQSGGIFTCHNPGCMPPDVQLQMFQRSFSTKGRGRGIGTYSIKLFAEKYLQGRVSFTSTPDAGTTFTVLLPAIPASSSALTAGT